MVVRSTRNLRRAATGASVATAVAFVLLVPVPVAAGSASPLVFNAREDFRVSPNQANPSGPWSYRRTAPDGTKPLLENFSTSAEPCGSSGDGFQSWFGPEVLDLPAVSKNATGADAFPCGAFVRKGAMMAHPGGAHAVVISGRVRWQARSTFERDSSIVTPSAETVSIGRSACSDSHPSLGATSRTAVRPGFAPAGSTSRRPRGSN